MDDFSAILVSCDNQDRIIGAVDKVLPRLPKELRDKLTEIKGSMIQHIGEEGMFVCLNGKTVASIIKEYGEVFKLQLVTSGEIDGVRFQLAEAPKTKIKIDEFGRPITH